ncbi:hypothetical protein DE146DRAFT_284655 [Phaeosphaeria sp. MPI-PUGE-AT-0046c]|nr:hypothetical protein DE146DRAFT_284655 [Phaeosphaeria sp. MPI-PUGE-AT-0046c]
MWGRRCSCCASLLPANTSRVPYAPATMSHTMITMPILSCLTSTTSNTARTSFFQRMEVFLLHNHFVVNHIPLLESFSPQIPSISCASSTLGVRCQSLILCILLADLQPSWGHRGHMSPGWPMKRLTDSSCADGTRGLTGTWSNGSIHCRIVNAS